MRILESLASEHREGTSVSRNIEAVESAIAYLGGDNAYAVWRAIVLSAPADLATVRTTSDRSDRVVAFHLRCLEQRGLIGVARDAARRKIVDVADTSVADTMRSWLLEAESQRTQPPAPEGLSPDELLHRRIMRELFGDYDSSGR